ncbi:MAG: DUF4304 domain-containing protein [bacterium]
MNTKELEGVFDSVLAPAGFRRRKDTWYKTNEDAITLVNLQKSQWGGQYYVNLAVYLRVLGKATSPSEHQSHIRVRLTAIAGSDVPAIEAALDFERSGITTELRKNVIAQALTTIALPFLAERSVLPRLRELYAGGQLGPVLITKLTRELLEGAAA